eukprot:9492428-Karenia_brevis.AAC.1
MRLLRLPAFRLQLRDFMGWWLRCIHCSKSLSRNRPTTPRWSHKELLQLMGLTLLPSKLQAHLKMLISFGLQMGRTVPKQGGLGSPSSRFLAALRRKLLQMHGQ